MPAASADFAKPENNKYPGYRLGFPEEGRGSMAGFWRRLGGLVVDWASALGIGNALFGGEAIAISAIFLVLTAVSIIMFGGSLGHLVFGMQVTTLAGEQPGWWRPAVRQLLLILVLPAIVWDSDNRGGHDIVSGLALRARR
ncbi:RDD family protein [Pseudoclavibacter endophyticus]|uniref:RDD family protein n=1 Tax=Pseudoclavibacter endophyticus TaxID=1778590 RepID=A0A6H9WU69_9MICO|nr:RDD family protein [Pseudoclavibacter endophyticus]KAB1650014.1 RDD family protein [Pseudoclavibacter endophyticus]GGA57976.1 RDD family protein [Pseudoclavibacter endophyticus]